MAENSPQRRQFQFSLAGLLLLVTLASLCMCGMRVVNRRISFTGVTAAKANWALSQTLSPPMVPSQATNVDVYAYFQSGNASFDISGKELRSWCESRDWPLRRIIPPRGRPMRWEASSYPSQCPANLTDVWYFSNMSHRGGWTLVYDHSSGRAWLEYAQR
jgi:hypothetical protein